MNMMKIQKKKIQLFQSVRLGEIKKCTDSPVDTVYVIIINAEDTTHIIDLAHKCDLH